MLNSTVTFILPAHIASLAGPLLLGYLFNWALYGVLSVQVYIYYVAFPEDSRTTKCLVYGIYAIETAQTIIVAHDAFNSYAKGYGDLIALGSAQTEWLAVPIFSGIVSATVQIYYAYRVSVLSGSRILGACISLIALLQGVSAIAQGVQAFIIGDFADLATKAFASCAIWLAGSAACDLIIAGCMTILLLKRDTGVSSTHAIITRLIRLIIETGILTATAATIDLILFLVFNHMSYHGTVALTLAKFYSNSLLVLLNSRINILGSRNKSSEMQSSHISFAKSMSPIGNPPRAVKLNTRMPSYLSNGVHIQQQTWIESDSEAIPMEDRSPKKMNGVTGEF